jgi:hypothetical protein
MDAPHDWTECEPALLTVEGGSEPPPGAMDLAWGQVPDGDRLLFHQFCCLNRRDPAAMAAIARISALFEAVMRVN